MSTQADRNRAALERATEKARRADEKAKQAKERARQAAKKERALRAKMERAEARRANAERTHMLCELAGDLDHRLKKIGASVFEVDRDEWNRILDGLDLQRLAWRHAGATAHPDVQAPRYAWTDQQAAK